MGMNNILVQIIHPHNILALIIHPISSWFIPIWMNRRKLIPIHPHSPFIHHVLRFKIEDKGGGGLRYPEIFRLKNHCERVATFAHLNFVFWYRKTLSQQIPCFIKMPPNIYVQFKITKLNRTWNIVDLQYSYCSWSNNFKNALAF